MVGAVAIISAKLPGPVAEDHHEEEEEDPGYFEEDAAADAAEGFEESAYAPGDAAADDCGVSADLAGGAAGDAGTAASRDRDGGRSRNAAAGEPLTGHASCNAEANSENPANGLRFHTVYHGTSGWVWARNASAVCAGQLPFPACGRKVDETDPLPALFSAPAAAWR